MSALGLRNKSQGLFCETALRENLGIGNGQPRLSWQIETDLTNWRQTAYEVICFDADGGQREQTGRVEADQSVLIDWPFAPLQSRERVSLKGRVWETADSASAHASGWSEPLTVEVGLLDPADWGAAFISPDWEEDTSKANPAPYLRREFDLWSEVSSARLYITALGVYEAHLNGQVIGEQVFAPGWTVYDHRLRYQTFDVTDLLKPGRNALGAIVGEGWYRGRLGFGEGKRNIYGENLALLAQLEIEYADGSSERIVSDEKMTSFNHYALGAVADWMHRVVGGLAPTELGYRHLTIAPRPGGGLTHCQTRLRTPYGLAECKWNIEDGTIDLYVTIPPNTRALVTVPGSDLDPIAVGSGHWHWSADYTDPDARGPYTVDDLVGEIVINSHSRDAVLNVLQEAGVPPFMLNFLLNERGAPLRPVLHRLPNHEEAVQRMDEALAELPTD